jgi:two-component system cell cycle response regulator DivK
MSGEPVLVVDDNPQNLKLAKIILTRAGYTVHTAVDAEDALRQLATLKPRLILMDLQLPTMDGFELTRRLKADAATADIAIVAVTAFAMEADRDRALAAGCDDYLAKSIDFEQLCDMAARHVRKPPDSNRHA